MHDYSVKKAFDGHVAGDIVKLNGRQAKYLLLSGHIQLKLAEKPKVKDVK